MPMPRAFSRWCTVLVVSSIAQSCDTQAIPRTISRWCTVLVFSSIAQSCDTQASINKATWRHLFVTSGIQSWCSTMLTMSSRGKRDWHLISVEAFFPSVQQASRRTSSMWYLCEGRDLQFSALIRCITVLEPKLCTRKLIEESESILQCFWRYVRAPFCNTTFYMA